MLRLMFLGSYKVDSFLITVNFDEYLEPAITKTIVYHGSDVDLNRVIPYIDTDKFEFVDDTKFGLPRISPYIYQQLVKLHAIDEQTEEYFLIQDADTFAINNYTWYSYGSPIYLSTEARHFEDYLDFITDLTGLKFRNYTSFISEFFPMSQNLWSFIKESVESHTGKDIVTSVLETVKGNNFSEYELFGYLAKQLGIHTTRPQYRHDILEYISDKNFMDAELDLTQDFIGFRQDLILSPENIPKFVNRIKKAR